MLQSPVRIDPSRYPPLLKEIQDPPRQLYVLGALPNGDFPCLAIVGTRKASREGVRISEEFAEYLVGIGVVIVSGLAVGIDAAAHRGALKQGGITIAVLGTGLDHIYPAINHQLADKIVQAGGTILSEYAIGESVYKGNFLRRNRIISGLSLATLVIEAPQRSGAIATARLAAEQGREVFVVPNAPSNRNYVGSHDLIRDGAILVTSPVQLAEDMGWKENNGLKQNDNTEESFSIEEALIMGALREAGAPLKVDKIIESTKLEPRVVSITLTSLIIRDFIIEDVVGYKLKRL